MPARGLLATYGAWLLVDAMHLAYFFAHRDEDVRPLLLAAQRIALMLRYRKVPSAESVARYLKSLTEQHGESQVAFARSKWADDAILLSAYHLVSQELAERVSSER